MEAIPVCRLCWLLLLLATCGYSFNPTHAKVVFKEWALCDRKGNGDQNMPAAGLRDNEKDERQIDDVFFRAQNLVQKGTDEVKSVASTAGSGIKSVAGSTSSRIMKLARKGASDVKNVSNVGLSGLVEKGTSDIRMVRSAASGVAKRGTSNIHVAATAAGSGLVGIVQKGSTDVSTIVDWLDSAARSGVETSNKSARRVVLSFTGKTEYHFGDITKELLRRSTSADYNLQDVLLLLKVLLAIGASFAPLAKILPVTMLLDMLNVSLEARVGKGILEMLAGSLDERLTAAFTADEIGDAAKRGLHAGIASFTGQDSYEKGDIQRAVLGREAGEEKDDCEFAEPKYLELFVSEEFADWDELFRESHPDINLVLEETLESTADTTCTGKALDMKILREFEEWDLMFKEQNPGK